MRRTLFCLLALVLLAGSLQSAVAQSSDVSLLSSHFDLESNGTHGGEHENPCGCVNEGVCKEDHCLCPGGFTGDKCETRTSLNVPPFKVSVGFLIVLIAAWNIGKVFPYFMLPLITGYLFTGALAGPYVLNIMPEEDIRKFDFLDHMAVGFITFAAGGKLHVDELGSRGKVLFYNTIILLLVDYGLGVAAMMIGQSQIDFLDGMNTKEMISVGMLVGTIMIARSPASAIAMVQELKAKGPFTNLTLAVTIVMDLVVIIVYGLNIFILNAVFASGHESPWLLLGKSIGRMLISIVLGGILGQWIFPWFVFSWQKHVPKMASDTAQEKLEHVVEIFQMAVFLILTWLIFVAEQFFEEWLEAILVTMIAGVVLANYNPNGEKFRHFLHVLGPYVFLVDFTYTGACLAFDSIGGTLVVSFLLFIVRTLGLFAAAWAAGRLAGEPESSNRNAGLCYLTQAGVAIGLAKQVNLSYPSWGGGFTTMIVTSVIFTQLVGPPLNKIALRNVGETNEGTKVSSEELGATIIFADEEPETVSLASALDHILVISGWRCTNINTNSLFNAAIESANAKAAASAAAASSSVSYSSDVSDVEATPEEASSATSEVELQEMEHKEYESAEPQSAEEQEDPIAAAVRNVVGGEITSVVIMTDDAVALQIASVMEKHFPEIKVIVLARDPSNNGEQVSAPVQQQQEEVSPRSPFALKQPASPAPAVTHFTLSSLRRRKGAFAEMHGVSVGDAPDLTPEAERLLPENARLVHSRLSPAYMLAEAVMGGADTLEVDVSEAGHTDMEKLKLIIKRKRMERFKNLVARLRNNF